MDAPCRCHLCLTRALGRVAKGVGDLETRAMMYRLASSGQDPRKRLSADAMLRHPWTTGEQASGKVIQGVDEKLAAFQQVQNIILARHFPRMGKKMKFTKLRRGGAATFVRCFTV